MIPALNPRHFNHLLSGQMQREAVAQDIFFIDTNADFGVMMRNKVFLWHWWALEKYGATVTLCQPPCQSQVLP